MKHRKNRERERVKEKRETKTRPKLMVMAGIHHCYCIGHSETNKTKRIESFVFETIFFLAQTIIIRFGFFFFLLKSHHHHHHCVQQRENEK